MFESGGGGAAGTVVREPQWSAPGATGWLAGLDIAAAGAGGLLHGLEQVRKLSAWAAATQMRLLAAAEVLEHPGGDEKEYFSEEVGAVLSIDGWLAQSMMASARELVTRLPATLARLEDGSITAAQARLLADLLAPLTDQDATGVEQRVLPRAGGQTYAQFRRAVTRAVNRLAPSLAERRRAEAILGRRVRFRPGEDGMTTMTADLPTPDALRLETAVNHLAQTFNSATSEDQWTLNSRRADALVELAERYLNHPTCRCDQPPTTDPDADEADAATDADARRQRRARGRDAQESERGNSRRGDDYGDEDRDRDGGDGPRSGGGTGRERDGGGDGGGCGPGCVRHPSKPIKLRPRIQVTVALSTLLGLDDHPGELANYGPIPASLARELAAEPDSIWRRLLTDPQGHLIDYGQRIYRPPTDLDRFIRAKYQTCAYPTCTRPAEHNEIDHITPRNEGGPTNTNNLLPLCARHHHLKHEAAWTITHHPNTGTTHWTTPHGRTYTNTAPAQPTGDADT